MVFELDMIIYYIKIFVMNLYVYYAFNKILNKKKLLTKEFLFATLISIVLAGITTFIKFNINSILAIIVLCSLYGIVLRKITKNKIGFTLILTLVAYAICFICFGFAAVIEYIPYSIFKIESNLINLFFMLLIQGSFIYGIFKIKRFSKGFEFLKNKIDNDYVDIISLNITTLIILIYCLMGTQYYEIKKNIFLAFTILSINMFIVIQKLLIMYYKQKLLDDTIKQYEKEIKEKDEELDKIRKEREHISKINHEFYNRQKALEQKINNFNIESSSEIDLRDRVKELSKEYTEKLEEIKSLSQIPKSMIAEIDDMFKYMQTECVKNNIEFKLQIEGNMYYLINNLIPKNKLETLIGDHIRNAIIAINSSNSKNRRILSILGIKNNCYEFCVYDTGIEFEIDTLLKIGLERATTHKEDGGSGIGFMTTFETLKETGASLTIKEIGAIDEDEYTKAIIIRFDGLKRYNIYSYRAEKIINNSNRKMKIEKLIK